MKHTFDFNTRFETYAKLLRDYQVTKWVVPVGYDITQLGLFFDQPPVAFYVFEVDMVDGNRMRMTPRQFGHWASGKLYTKLCHDMGTIHRLHHEPQMWECDLPVIFSDKGNYEPVCPNWRDMIPTVEAPV